jgi:hypothetical protein
MSDKTISNDIFEKQKYIIPNNGNKYFLFILNKSKITNNKAIVINCILIIT